MYLILHRSDWLICRDIHTKFLKDSFRHSKVNRGGGRDSQTHRQHGDRISLLYENWLKVLSEIYDCH
jgi:hypothetical protein